MRRLRLLISAGPTREPLDPVRYLTNRSSGKMGYAFAKAAIQLGHRVTLVTGPTDLQIPKGAELHRVETAREMYRSMIQLAPKADWILMAAAVADYRPEVQQRQKIKKSGDTRTLKLIKNPDILKELGRRKKKKQFLVGFAAETQNLERHATRKLHEKNLNVILANLVGKKSAGFDSDQNELLLLASDGTRKKFSRALKKALAMKVLKFLLDTQPEISSSRCGHP